MRAILKMGLTEVPVPSLAHADDVLIRVAVAGVCRTDIYAARGLIDTGERIVLGHELSGTVVACGAAVRQVSPGARVTVKPVVGCGACPACARECFSGCVERQMIGVDRDGGFAEYICVPERVVVCLPATLDWMRGAYCEPVAAALAVLPIPQGHGAIIGDNRIAQLTQRVLRQVGHEVPIGPRELAPNSLRFAIETVADEPTLARVVEAIEPGGTLILKSRPHRAVALPLQRIVAKELILRGASYGSFQTALALLGSLPIDDLLGERFSLEAHARVFTLAEQAHSAKLFFAVEAPTA